MKKYLFPLLILIAILSGCSTKSPSMITHVDQSDGRFDYITGEALSDIKGVVSVREDGFRDQVSIKGKKFDLAIPSEISDKKLRLKVALKNGQKTILEIKLPKRAVIDSYDNFADRMNGTMNDLDENTETRFPLTTNDGTFIAADENEVQTWIHVRDSKLVGLSMTAGAEAEEELAAIIVSFILSYEVNNDKVYEAFNNFLDSGKTTTVTASGYKFKFDHGDNRVTIDIIKSVD